MKNITIATAIGQSMLTIQIDSRQQSGKHDLKDRYFAEHGIDTVHSKLFCGDYTLLNKQDVCIDTKRDFNEIVGNLTKDHKRVASECDRAYEHGIHLCFIIENTENITSINEVHKWSNKRYKIWLYNGRKGKPPVSSKRLEKMMKTFEQHHHCKFYFCKPESAGRAILFLLTGKDYGE